MINSEKVGKIDLEELTECPECDSEHIVRDYKRGEVTCSNCGLVVDDQVIDQGPEWRAFDSEQNERRARRNGHAYKRSEKMATNHDTHIKD